jgi:hypothetical protein
MNRTDQVRPAGQGRAHLLAGLLLAGAATTWLVAALLRWVLVPLLVADPALAAHAGAVPPVPGAFALAGALAGALLLLGLAFTWFAPLRGAGRVLLLVAGLLAGAGGALLLAIGTFGYRLGQGAAVALVAVGLLAGVASLSDWLPGPSLVERMRLPYTVHPTRPARERMPPLTAAFAVGWVALAGALLATHGPFWFLGLQWGMPILAGALAVGWREGQPNRLKTLGLAGVAGLAMDWLLLLTLHVTQYYHNLDGTPSTPPSYIVWWGLMGALFGAIGYSLWGPLTRPTQPTQPTQGDPGAQLRPS